MGSSLRPRTRRKTSMFVVAAFVTVLTVAAAVWHFVYSFQTEATHRNLLERVSLYETTIRQTIARFSYLPHLLSRDLRVSELLKNTANSAFAEETNRLLEDFAAASGASALYVLDTTGLTLAASNWNQPLSYVGRNYAFRPYFIEALASGEGRFYGVGVTTGEPGYFLSARVGPAEAPLGVVTAKISLAALEQEWRAANETVLLADENGIVFLSSRPDWIYRAMSPLTASARFRAQETHQYPHAELGRPSIFQGLSEAGRLVYSGANAGAASPFLIAKRNFGEHQWTVAVLSSFSGIFRQAGSTAAIAGLAVVVVMLLAVVWMQRRTAIRAKLRAHDLLERRVVERTQDLVVANDSLSLEIEQRQIAEVHLRQTQDELIQAGKLAALGHMSAAVSHEISQPLAALRTYVSSTAKLVHQGNTESVLKNVSRMETLLVRIADITGHLKRFARSETGDNGVCEIRSVVRNALDLVNARLESEGVVVAVSQPEIPTFVRGTESRLEQVVINLLNNAIDAMLSRPSRSIRIGIGTAESEVAVEVEDTGCGIPPEFHGLVFAPFFTTKDVGAGLGLGLSISHSIVSSLGGTLTAAPGPAGGATFVMTLAAAERHHHSQMKAAE